MTALVTGATGFLGSAVARRLIERGESVRLLTRPNSDRRNLEGLKAELVEGDLRDRRSLERALKGCTSLYHVAADYRLWVRRPQELYDSNVEGSRNIMLAAAEAGVARIVYTSSVAVLGPHKDGTPADEASPVAETDMIGPYKHSKFMAERAVKELVAAHRIPVVIVNPSTPVGPRDVKPTPTGRLIVEAARGKMPAYVDTGLNLVHVDDCAAGHLLAMERGEVGERYILGGEDMSLRDILAAIAAIVGRRPPLFRIPHNAVYPVALLAEAKVRVLGGREPMTTRDSIRMAKKKMFFSSAKAQAALGYRPRPAADGLRDAVAWFNAHGYI
ncbi:MAG: hopanoid-associated sugar epimerase [Alphaproteobacteria bacterium]